MKFIIIFLASFIVVYLAYLITVILNKKKLSKFKTSNQVLLLVKKYGVKITDSNIKNVAYLVAFSNSFIIATAITIVELVNNFVLKILIAFLVIVPLILTAYSLMGKYLQKKECK